MNYYNENDPFAAKWLESLIANKLIPQGHVDGRDIKDVQSSDLHGYTQHHFFAGIGGWPLALQYAGWPTTRPVWSASCPCQPLSCAGKGQGADDERHLWPELYRLASEYRPVTLFGEQVASADGLEWFDGISLDLEEIGYAIGAADLPASCVGAPHIRQRLWWVADATSDGWGDKRISRDLEQAERTQGKRGHKPTQTPNDSGTAGGLPDTVRIGQQGQGRLVRQGDSATSEDRQKHRTDDVSRGHWGGAESVPCGDGKARRIEPGISPLAHGIPGRVGLLKGYGNAIVPQVAAKFIGAYMEVACG